MAGCRWGFAMVRALGAESESLPFDVIVIGAGINGAGIARDAAMRGLRVLLIDKGDIASGTTSWSTRLIHGGLRYLEHAEFSLVRESLREREYLLHNAPHLVKPLPLVLPIYREARRGPFMIRAGMVLYDMLSYDKTLERHHMLNRKQTLKREPGLDPKGLRGGALYYDAQVTFPERLAVENVLSAHQHGATVLTYTRADRLLTEGAVVRGIEMTDLLSGQHSTVRGKVVVNVAGPWVDQVLTGENVDEKRMIGGTKGSHLVVNPFPDAPKDAVYYEARSDGRAIFIVPWNERYLIGTTDIRFTGDLDDVRADESEIAYLIREANALIPSASLTEEDVLYSYSGVRPLPYKPEGEAGAITRQHIIHNHAPRLRGLFSIIGGKLTTYRSLAEEAVDEICERLGVDAKSRTATTRLPGAAGVAYDTFRKQFIEESGLPSEVAGRLVGLYGVRANDVTALTEQNPELAIPFDPNSGAIAAEIVFAFEHEDAQTLEDA
ncbi:MAG TPA: glycerol-3-phosphate dehydrogenase, partial [Thermomicrobiales bacterium]|nr:glycerol-3-phosphate dehydrogenase [Thermomicrobiales bacterium]